MTTDYRRTHHRKPGYLDVLEILRRLLDLAGQPERPGWHLEARKIRHHDRAPFLSWDEAGRRTKGATPRAWTEFTLGWTNAHGAFEGPPDQAGPATTWERALLAWANALAKANPCPDLDEARSGIEAIILAVEASRGPQPRKIDRAIAWLKCLFAGTRRTEIPAAEIFQRAQARGIRQNTLLRAKKAAGYGSRERRKNGRSSWLWTRPKPKGEPQDGGPQQGTGKEPA